MRLVDGIPVWGTSVDEGALSQIKTCAKTAARVAMMADHHKGYAVPIGGVVAYENAISPSGVGYDIACGNKAVKLDCKLKDVAGRMPQIMDEVVNRVSFGVGRKNNTTVDHPLFDDVTWKHEAVKGLKDMARGQLGTVGSGNHYVDVFHADDEDGTIWVGCHFGSRGLGHKTATWFLEKGGAKDGMDVEPLVLPMDSYLGYDYWECMKLAGRYAYAGRDWVCDEVARIIGAPIVEEVHNHHNFAWLERHDGTLYYVVRKGATPAWPGQKGFVGSTMGEASVILEGVECDSAKDALYSTVHGAGRIMSRTAAAGKVKRRKAWTCQNYRNCGFTAPAREFNRASDGTLPKCLSCGSKMRLSEIREQVSKGLIDWEAESGMVKSQGIELRGAGADEAPGCYKRLPEVLAEHSDSVRVLTYLYPIGVAMAGAGEFDPYKD